MSRQPEGLIRSEGKLSFLEYHFSARDQVPRLPLGKTFAQFGCIGNLAFLSLKIKQAKNNLIAVEGDSLQGEDRRSEIQDRLRRVGMKGGASCTPSEGAGIPFEDPDRLIAFSLE